MIKKEFKKVKKQLLNGSQTVLRQNPLHAALHQANEEALQIFLENSQKSKK